MNRIIRFVADVFSYIPRQLAYRKKLKDLRKRDPFIYR